ncbi:MAG: hypothetical protein ACO3A4_14815 [Silvanigrellaceae bacterium]
MGKVIQLFGGNRRPAESMRETPEEPEEEVPPSREEMGEILRQLNHREQNVHQEAKQKIIHFAEAFALVADSFVPEWKAKVTELLELDNRTNRFASLYLRTVDYCECLAAVGKWIVHNDTHELPRFFLWLELESHIISGGRRDFSNIATDYLDFLGYSYFIDHYPNAIDYMMGLLEGECAPILEKPAKKVFGRLCKFKQHDKICQIMRSAVTVGDLGKVDWFTRNLYPFHFENYDEYEQELIELIGSESMPVDVRENAVNAIFFISEEFLLKKSWCKEFVMVARTSFSRQDLEILVPQESHPKLFKMLTQALFAVRGTARNL